MEANDKKSLTLSNGIFKLQVQKEPKCLRTESQVINDKKTRPNQKVTKKENNELKVKSCPKNFFHEKPKKDVDGVRSKQWSSIEFDQGYYYERRQCFIIEQIIQTDKKVRRQH